MSNPLHDIDKLFKNAIDDHAEMPASSVWDAVDKSLDKKNINDISRKYRALKRVAAALLLLLIGSGIYMAVVQTKKNQTGIAEANNIKENKKQVTPATDPSNVNKKNKNTSDLTTGNNISTTITDQFAAAETKKDNKLKAAETPVNAANSNKNIGTPADSQTIKKQSKNKINRSGRAKMNVTNGEADEITGVENMEPANEKTRATSITNNNEYANLQMTRLPAISAQLIIAADLKTRALPLTATNKNIPVNNRIVLLNKTNNASAKKGRIALIPFWGPNVASFRLEDDHHGRHHDEDKDDIKNDEHDPHSSTVGLLIDIPLKKNWSIQSGISLTSKTINIEPKKIFADFDNDGDVQYRLNCSAGYAFVSPKTGVSLSVGDSIETNRSVTKLQYLAVPLAIKYHYDYKKITLFGIAGIAVNFLTKGKIDTEMPDNTFTDKNASTSISGLKTTYLSGSMGAGIACHFTKHLAVNFMPTYNFALGSITQNAAVKSYPNSLNIAAGLRFTF